MANRTKRTPKRDEGFFGALASGLSVGAACKTAGYARTSVYEYREADEGFARRWQEADSAAVELMETEADRRAMKGTLEPVFHRGEKCGSVRKYSDTLLMFRLKAKRPQTYRDRASLEHSGPGGGPIAYLDAQRQADEELRQWQAAQEKGDG